MKFTINIILRTIATLAATITIGFLVAIMLVVGEMTIGINRYVFFVICFSGLLIRQAFFTKKSRRVFNEFLIIAVFIGFYSYGAYLDFVTSLTASPKNIQLPMTFIASITSIIIIIVAYARRIRK